MRRALCLVLTALAGAGCSVLFDPSKVPITSDSGSDAPDAAVEQCPASPARCASRLNAKASCVAETCVYECSSGFADLDDSRDNGCETSCSALATPVAPASVVATVGAAPDAIEWEWVSSPPATTYRFCTDALDGGAPSCTQLAAASTCDAGVCTTTSRGHTPNSRVLGRVTAINGCAAASPESTLSTTPIDTTRKEAWSIDSPCGVVVSHDSELINLTHPAGCVSTLVLGDELWARGTLDVDVRLASISDGAVGVVAHASTGTDRHRVLAVTYKNTIAAPSRPTRLSQRKMTGADRELAGSINGAVPDAWWHLRLVFSAGEYLVLGGPSATELTELVRWRDADPTAASRRGRFGLAAWGAMQAQLRNLRVSTRAPAASGPATRSENFADGGVPMGFRIYGDRATIGRCPSYPSATDCATDAGCQPSIDAACALIDKGFFNGSTLGFDLPSGLDVLAPWRVSFRFATKPDAGALPVSLLGGNDGQWLTSPTNNFGAPLTVFGGRDGGVLAVPGTWNRFDVSVDPAGSRVSAALNGRTLVLPDSTYPPSWSAHPGGFFFSEGFLTAVDWAVTDVTVAQP